MKTSIIIPIHFSAENEKDILSYTESCLISVQKYTNLTNNEVILVINGCTVKGIELTNSFLQFGFKAIYNWGGLGFPGAVNEGIKIARGEYIVLLNNDCVLLEQPFNQWIDKLIQPFEDKAVGITGVHYLICPVTKIKFVVGYCMAIRAATLKHIGVFDEIFNPGFGEEIDLCGRAIKSHWKVIEVGKNDKANAEMVMGDFPIYHKGAATLGLLDMNPIHERNMKILAERKKLGLYGF